jgi:asparagine synthase (glutamine-hydrolysing)
VLADMSDAMLHRGPDDHGLWAAGHIGLAHRRLAIRDLSVAGRQPMSDVEQRVFVTYNGEIYNDRVLRRELERDFGVTFRTTCDTEILPYAYLAWGDDMFDRLEGMFAIALWDVAHERLVLGRDGIGIKPLFFAETASTIIFASEMKGILASRVVPPALDPEGFHTFLAAGHAGPSSTLVCGVEQVPPGSVVSFSRGIRRGSSFWQPRRSGEIGDLDAAVEFLSRALEEVVEDQLVSDVPLGILQSGGIDSTLISLTAGRKGAKAPLFTASFDEPTHDEADLARQVAAAANLPHRVSPADRTEDLERVFRSVVHHFDGQYADTGALGFCVLSQVARQHSTVVLSGDGGDEFFCGYDTYAATRTAEIVRRLMPSGFLSRVGQVAYWLDATNEGPAAGLGCRSPLRIRAGRGTRSPALGTRSPALGMAALGSGHTRPKDLRLGDAGPFGDIALPGIRRLLRQHPGRRAGSSHAGGPAIPSAKRSCKG